MAKSLVSVSTARYFAEQAYKLALYNGIDMKTAKTREGVSLEINRDRPNRLYIVSWFEGSMRKSRTIRIAKSWAGV